MSHAQADSFFYRSMHKRIIAFDVLDPHRWLRIAGPLVYMVAEADGTLRYVGRHLNENALKHRWVRRGHLHHQEAARNLYIQHLEAGRGPLTVWSASAAELRPHLQLEGTQSNADIARGLEALWIKRWRLQLWNASSEPLVAGVRDRLA